MYVGPYRIIRKLSELTHEIRKSPKEKSIVVHVDKLKKCVSMNETTRINCIQNVSVHALQEMPDFVASCEADL